MNDNTPPPLYALVLCGGYSSRMGRDKALIPYHGVPQYRHAAALVTPCVENVFLSCRAEQAEHYPGLPCLVDAAPWAGRGPLGGVRSAMAAFPAAAWLVVGVDYPLLHSHDLAWLLHHRNPLKVGTAFRHPETGFVEPLIAIYEPAMAARIDETLATGRESLRYILETHGHLLIPPDAARLKSFDTTRS